MSYFSNIEDGPSPSELGCGPECNCGPCKTTMSGLNELYVKEEIDGRQQQAPTRHVSSAPLPQSGLSSVGHPHGFDTFGLARRTKMYIRPNEGLGGLPTSLPYRPGGGLSINRRTFHGFGEPAVAARPKADLVFDKFEFGLSLVPATHKPAIDALADRIVAIARQVPGPLGTVRLVGHTDFIDTEKYNQALGMMRAKAVRGALATALEARLRGVTSRIDIVPESRGEFQPVKKDPSAASRELNRRVEVFLALKFVGTPKQVFPDLRVPKDYDVDRRRPPYRDRPSATDQIIATNVPKLPRKCVKPYDAAVKFLRRLLNKALEGSPIPQRFHK